MLKKGIAFLICVSIICAGFCFSAFAQNSENLILNSDFESGNVDNWSYYGGDISISEYCHSGNYSLHSTSGEITQVIEDIEADSFYIYSAWVKPEENPMILCVNIWDDKEWNENNNNYGNWAVDNTLINVSPDNWIYAEKVFQTTPETQNVRIQIWKGKERTMKYGS